jgi:cytochrome c5
MRPCLLVATLTTISLSVMPAWSADDARISLGAKVFAANCKVCHETGKAGSDAPQISETAEWKSRLGGGREAIYKNSIVGFSGYFTMPARGGNPSLTDDEVKAAVDYMLAQAGVR